MQNCVPVIFLVCSLKKTKKYKLLCTELQKILSCKTPFYMKYKVVCVCCMLVGKNNLKNILFVNLQCALKRKIVKAVFPVIVFQWFESDFPK